MKKWHLTENTAVNSDYCFRSDELYMFLPYLDEKALFLCEKVVVAANCP